ncbi:MAG: carotenoid oxygenase family protein [Myxococcota bacterium]|nr:carotenoid oxygenase family protein [Myxococcota bacterium]
MKDAERERAWNRVMTAAPGDLDLRVPPGAIEGQIPSSLRGGRLLSNGPGWTQIGDRLAHPFDGHGYVRSYGLEPDGGVVLRARFVRTRVLRDEQRAGRLVHRGLATNPDSRFWRNLGGGEPRNVANTTLVPWGGRLLAGWEGGAPHALDPDTLETLGVETFGGAIADQATLAHMHHDPHEDRLILCSVAMGRRTTLRFREVDRGGRVVAEREAPLPGLGFVHDFAFTERWYVVAGNPIALRPWALARSLVGAGTLLSAIRTRPDAPGELILVPRRGGRIRRVTLPSSAFVVHFANAFERDGAVVVDACAFDDFSFGEELGYQGPSRPLDPGLPDARGPQRLYRVTAPDGSSEASWERLAPHGVDFPRVAPRARGRAAPWMVGACRADPRHSDPFDSVLRVDLDGPREAPRLWTAPPGTFVGEPLIATDRAGGPAHVLALVSDAERESTTLVILDETLAPVARARLPLMPVAFHGEWVAAR